MAPQVRETSRRVFGRSNTNTVKAEKSLDAVKRDFSDIVLPGQLQERVRALAAVTANTKRHGAPFRHMMFYGARARLLVSVTPACSWGIVRPANSGPGCDILG